MSFDDGGEAAIGSGYVGQNRPPQAPAGMQLNLENDSGLAQGSQTQWAQPTAISSVITGLLKSTQQAPQDYWQTWSQNNGQSVTMNPRSSSPFGYDINTQNVQQQEQTMIGNDPYGAFGTNQVMQEEGDEPATNTPAPVAGAPGAGQALPGEKDPTNSYYNPWGFGQGADNNAYGPSSEYMGQATMEAMQLANNYFAPQRMELAYELGDMETDMRRLAVNLGRQVDDPTLQAKLYKEAMRSVRALDVQQNTLALQMADQRRKEELQNFQYYDALAQNEYSTRWNNQQFYDNLGLQSAYFDLQNSIGMAQPYTSDTKTQSTTPPAQQQQEQMGGLNSLYNSMMKYNPYGNNGGNLL
jgi:hypothetical protein